VNERGHVHELDRRAGRERRLRGRGCQEDEERPQTLATGRERFAADLRNEARLGPHGRGQTALEVLEIGVEARGLADRRKAQLATPMCSATIPPPKVRQRTSSNPAARTSSASSSGPGKRRTLAGRYV
jgi:hypothetical protein